MSQAKALLASLPGGQLDCAGAGSCTQLHPAEVHAPCCTGSDLVRAELCGPELWCSIWRRLQGDPSLSPAWQFSLKREAKGKVGVLLWCARWLQICMKPTQ